MSNRDTALYAYDQDGYDFALFTAHCNINKDVKEMR